MNKLALTAALATLLAGPAFAQGTGPASQTSPPGPLQGTVADPNRAPSFTQGSGQRAGGPANELNSSTGAGMTTGTVRGAEGMPQPGSGQRAGGPANELNPSTGTTMPGMARGADGMPQPGSGQQSGGPRPQ